MIAEETARPIAAVPEVTDLELRLLADAVQSVTGHDFRDYAPAPLRRRVLERVRAENVATISGLQERVLHDRDAMERLIDTITFNPSTPLGDAAFLNDFRAQVLPRLRTFPYVRIWVAGCGAGDDAYALAMLCREAQFAHRVRIYATDATERAVGRARAGVLPPVDIDELRQRYLRSGGTSELDDYLERGGELRYGDELRENMVFAQHNLATDSAFNEFHCVVARRVLGKYNRTVVYHVHQVVYESLVRLGFLGLGAKESLRLTPHQRAYDAVPETQDFYRRVR